VAICNGQAETDPSATFLASKAATQMAGSGPSLRRPSGHRVSQEADSAGSNHLG